MSENKTPEVIYVENGIRKRFETAESIHTNFEGKYTPYILKSKYDELLKEKEELEKKLHNCEEMRNIC